MLATDRRPLFAGACVVALASLVLTATALVRAERLAGETDVDVLTTSWIRANVPRGKRVARHDEDNTYLPLEREQLVACADAPTRAGAYSEKMRIVGWDQAHAESEPMRLAVLNDELFRAYWCRRELVVSDDTGFRVVPYHSEPRFGAVLERDAIAAFRAESDDDAIDVLISNRQVDAGVAPAARFATARGQRFVYIR
ncbi:MAG: hypothetical protein QM736_06420 [Vicinamibacterales bacterium]